MLKTALKHPRKWIFFRNMHNFYRQCTNRIFSGWF